MPHVRRFGSRGFLVVFEGIDRSGKSTQAKMVYDRLIRDGHAAELFRFPDRSTTIGGILNSYLEAKNSNTRLWSPQLLHLLFSANRWEMQPKLYEALNRGAVVIVDRYSFSGSELYEKEGIQEKVHAAYQQFQRLPYWHSVAAGQDATPADLHEQIYQKIKEALFTCKDASTNLPFTRKLLWDE